MSIQKVTVAGGGTLGSQIAYQTAYTGKTVIVYDINDGALSAAKTRINDLDAAYQQDMHATQADIDETHSRLTYTSDAHSAFGDVDLVIEAIPEVPAIKTNFYELISGIADARTIFASNSSTYLPSQFADKTGRPSQFANLHFANQIWKHNTAEIMGHAGTDAAVITALTTFARDIAMVPIVVRKEQPGYVLNSLLTPFLENAAYLWGEDIADPQTVDKTWMIDGGAPMGPFATIDLVGLRTFLNITKDRQGDNPAFKNTLAKVQQMIDDGKLGLESGKGFYTYPDPAYQQKDFLA